MASSDTREVHLRRLGKSEQERQVMKWLEISNKSAENEERPC